MTVPGARWPLSACALTAAAALAVVAGGTWLGRTLLVLAFVLLAPGMALVPLAGLRDGWANLVLATGVSAALAALVAAALGYAGAWSPDRILVPLADVTLLAAALQLVPGGRARALVLAVQAPLAAAWLAWVVAA